MRKETSTNLLNENALKNYCNAFKTLSLFKGRWKLSILFLLNEKSIYYSEFKNLLPEISDCILSKQLTEMISDNLLENMKTKTNSLYSLTPKGDKLVSTLISLSEFNLNN